MPEFTQIRADKVSKELGYGFTLIASTLLLFSLLVTFMVLTKSSTVAVIVGFFGGQLIFKYAIRNNMRDYAKKKDMVGEVSFNQEEIVFSEADKSVVVATDQVSSLYLHHNYVQGLSMGRHDVMHNGIATLELTTKQNQFFKFKFLLKTEEELEEFKKVWSYYYRMGIAVKEEFGNERLETLCFQYTKSMSYKDLRELKSSLGLL